VLVDHQAPDPRWVAYGAGTSLALLIVGYQVFKWLESQFAERI
jgi:ABC-type polysaccharide/polyol phosphate export permease